MQYSNTLFDITLRVDKAHLDPQVLQVPEAFQDLQDHLVKMDMMVFLD